MRRPGVVELISKGYCSSLQFRTDSFAHVSSAIRRQRLVVGLSVMRAKIACMHDELRRQINAVAVSSSRCQALQSRFAGSLVANRTSEIRSVQTAEPCFHT